MSLSSPGCPPEVAGHHQGGSVPTEASAPQYYPVPGLLPEGAHGLGEHPTPTPTAALPLPLLRPIVTLVWSPGQALGTAWWGDLGKEEVSPCCFSSQTKP